MATQKDKAPAVAPDIAAMTFEAAMRELEEIVRRLEQGKVELDESIRIYERGQALKAHCEEKLRSAQARIDRIVERADGAKATEPMDME
ncbi:MAG: exodeoxyribonuclease VII small subunit [Alphaproteobacteria bacterium]|nr:exodeoxyribonuclease VII small subunit [Alphaproteobacteria bacterium]